MDNLQEFVHALTKDEQREFRIFIHRKKRKKERKDLELFEILIKDEEVEPEEIVGKLYSLKPAKRTFSTNNAYHTIRKRLFRQLSDFIVMKRLDEDPTTASSVMGLISISRYLFDRKLHRQAWHYLNNAEEIAKTNEQFDWLNTIYHLQIEHAQTEGAGDLKIIIKRRIANKKFADEDERATIAYSIIRQQLNEVIIEGKNFNFNYIIKKVLRKCDLENAIMQRPKLLFNMVSIMRSATLAKKDFYRFQPFITTQYKLLEQNHGFSKSNHHYKLGMIYMVAHAFYRNRKFNEAMVHADRLWQEMNAFNKIHFAAFYVKYIMLKATICTYKGKNHESISMLKTVLDDNQIRLSLKDELNIRFNLSVFHLNANDYHSANQILLSLGHTDQWLEKKMGTEWLLKKSMIGMIVQFDLGHDDIALNHIRSIEKRFSELFNHPAYKRVKTYLGFVRQLVFTPVEATTPAFEEKVRKSLVILPEEEEDLQDITLFSWLISKIQKRDYYEVLLEMVKSSTPD